MKLGERAFGEFEMIRQQLGYSERRLGNAAVRVTVRLPDDMIKLVRHESSHGAGIDKFLHLARFSPQRRTEEGVQRRAVNIAKGKNHSFRHCARGKGEWSADRVFETSTRLGGTARAAQANQGGVVVFRATPVNCGILPFHMNRRRLQEIAHFPLHLRSGRGRDGRVRGQENDQFLFMRRERSPFRRRDGLRAAYANAHAEHAGEGEDVCNTRHSNHSLVQKI